MALKSSLGVCSKVKHTLSHNLANPLLGTHPYPSPYHFSPECSAHQELSEKVCSSVSHKSGTPCDEILLGNENKQPYAVGRRNSVPEPKRGETLQMCIGVDLRSWRLERKLGET